MALKPEVTDLLERLSDETGDTINTDLAFALAKFIPGFRFECLTSIDAAGRLIEELLPGSPWSVHVGYAGSRPGEASISLDGLSKYTWTVEAETAPLALVRVLLVVFMMASEIDRPRQPDDE